MSHSQNDYINKVTSKKRLGSFAILSLLIKVGGAFVSFLCNVLFTRLMQAESVGIFFLVFSFAKTGSILLRAGLPETIVKYVSEALASEKKKDALSIILTGNILILFVSLIFVVVVSVVPVDRITAHPLANLSLMAALLTMLFAIQSGISESLRSLHHLGSAMLFDSTMMNILMFILLVLAYILGMQFEYSVAISLLIISAFTALLLSIFVLLKKIKVNGPIKIRFDSVLIRYGLPVMLVNLSTFMVSQLGLWLTEIYLASSDVAIYGAVMRFVQLVMLPLFILNSVIQPSIAGLLINGKRAELQSIMRAGASISFLLTLLMSSVLYFSGEAILSAAFGEMYGSGHIILNILMVGYLINSWSGSCGALLVQTGHQVYMVLCVIFSGLVIVMSSAILAESYGVEGIALASALGIAFQNIILTYVGKKVTGVTTYANFEIMRILKLKQYVIKR